MYATERNKNPTESSKKAKGADKIAQEVNKKYNTTLLGWTIMRYVVIWVSPFKTGPDGGVLDEHFRLLLIAVETYICMSQIKSEV